MRYPATEKLEIIRLVEGSHLPARQAIFGPIPLSLIAAIPHQKK